MTHLLFDYEWGMPLLIEKIPENEQKTAQQKFMWLEPV